MYLYEILKISPDASLREIKVAYKKLALKYHPDKVGNSDINNFYTITTAYSILSDPEKKYQYDMFGIINEDINDVSYNEKIPNITNFFATIKTLCAKLFINSDFYAQLNLDTNIDDMINNNDTNMANDYIIKLINKHLSINFNDATSDTNSDEKQFETEFEESDNKESINNNDIVIDIVTNIEEIYNGKFKKITFDRQIYEHGKMIIETTTLSVPVCEDKIIFENEGNHYINDDNLMVKSKVIINVKCLHSKYYKRVNNYDILIFDTITQEELNNGYKKKLKYFNKNIILKCKNPLKKFKNNKITTKINKSGIPYYKNGNYTEINYGDLIIILYLN